MESDKSDIELSETIYDTVYDTGNNGNIKLLKEFLIWDNNNKKVPDVILEKLRKQYKGNVCDNWKTNLTQQIMLILNKKTEFWNMSNLSCKVSAMTGKWDVWLDDEMGDELLSYIYEN